MYCTRCGKQLGENEERCSYCGTVVKKERVTTESVKNSYQESKTDQSSTYTTMKGQQNTGISGLPIKNYNPCLDYNPIGMWGYFFYFILFSIPVIGWIMLILFSLGITKNVNLRNLARSFFCIYIIIIIALLIVAPSILGAVF